MLPVMLILFAKTRSAAVAIQNAPLAPVSLMTLTVVLFVSLTARAISSLATGAPPGLLMSRMIALIFSSSSALVMRSMMSVLFTPCAVNACMSPTVMGPRMGMTAMFPSLNSSTPPKRASVLAKNMRKMRKKSRLNPALMILNITFVMVHRSYFFFTFFFAMLSPYRKVDSSVLFSFVLDVEDFDCADFLCVFDVGSAVALSVDAVYGDDAEFLYCGRESACELDELGVLQCLFAIHVCDTYGRSLCDCFVEFAYCVVDRVFVYFVEVEVYPAFLGVEIVPGYFRAECVVDGCAEAVCGGVHAHEFVSSFPGDVSCDGVSFLQAFFVEFVPYAVLVFLDVLHVECVSVACDSAGV